MSKVNITKENGITYFNYEGIEIDSVTWEGAPCPICCKDITDDDYCDIVITLYNILVDCFGKEQINKYINKMVHGVDFDDIDDFRWREEEKLFLDYGGRYYEDMTDEEYAQVCGLAH